ncbi:hypothetical protein AAZX31_08G078400 [Glycine max]
MEETMARERRRERESTDMNGRETNQNSAREQQQYQKAVKLCLGDLLVMGSNPETVSQG